MSEHVLSTHTLIRLLALFVCLFDFVVVVGEGIWRGLMNVSSSIVELNQVKSSIICV